MQIEISDKIFRAIADSKTDVTAFVEQAVQQALAKQKSSLSADQPTKSFYDVAVESGLIGGGSEYASDLSTNPKHMEGFGR